MYDQHDAFLGNTIHFLITESMRKKSNNYALGNIDKVQVSMLLGVHS